MVAIMHVYACAFKDFVGRVLLSKSTVVIDISLLNLAFKLTSVTLYCKIMLAERNCRAFLVVLYSKHRYTLCCKENFDELNIGFIGEALRKYWW